MRGGTIENVFVRDVEIGEVGSAIDIDMLYEEGASGAFVPVVRNVRVERMTVRTARHAFFIRGLAASPVNGLSVRDSVFQGVAEPSRLEGVEELVLRNVVLEPAGRTATMEERR
jgi:unsaturated rhamnogalacturonyl hydrolase